MHYWGDDDFDWEALNGAVHHYFWWLYHFAGMCVYTKEKYGTLRIQAFYLGTIYKSLYFGHKWKWYGKLRWYMNSWSRHIPGLARYQRLIFNIATLRAIKKWSHIKEEIMDESFFNELLYSWVKKKVGYVNNWRSV